MLNIYINNTTKEGGFCQSTLPEPFKNPAVQFEMPGAEYQGNAEKQAYRSTAA